MQLEQTIKIGKGERICCFVILTRT